MTRCAVALVLTAVLTGTAAGVARGEDLTLMNVTVGRDGTGAGPAPTPPPAVESPLSPAGAALTQAEVVQALGDSSDARTFLSSYPTYGPEVVRATDTLRSRYGAVRGVFTGLGWEIAMFCFKMTSFRGQLVFKRSDGSVARTPMSFQGPGMGMGMAMKCGFVMGVLVERGPVGQASLADVDHTTFDGLLLQHKIFPPVFQVSEHALQARGKGLSLFLFHLAAGPAAPFGAYRESALIDLYGAR